MYIIFQKKTIAQSIDYLWDFTDRSLFTAWEGGGDPEGFLGII